MEISVAGYKISLVTLLLIGLVMFVLTGHTLCGCCEVQGFDGFKEAFTEGVKGKGGDKPAARKAVVPNKM
jgi:hypothetical protein